MNSSEKMFSKFETEIVVRPSDIDYNGHVHQSVYLDYLLFARVDQMKRYYKVPIEEFFARGLSWATKTTTIDYKRPLFMDESVTVRTWIEEIKKMTVKVRYQFLKSSGKIAAEGHSVYFLLNSKTGKPVAIPDEIIRKYSI